MAANDTMASGGFGVTQNDQNPTGPSSVPIPGSMPIAQQETPIVKNNVNVQGGSSGGGGIGGLIGGLGKILGGLFAEGGLVKMAEGGTAGVSNIPSNQPNSELLEQPAQQEQNPMEQPLAMGYLIGAYHQQKFGGTPDTLEKAASEIKQQVIGQQGAPTEQPVRQPAPKDMLEPGPAPAAPQQPMPQPAPAQAMPRQAAMPQAQPAKPTMTGYMQPTHFAAGGPPLAPGQEFQGDGSVEGPGTATSDSIPAKLSDGEYVMSAAATQFFGVDKLEKMNTQGKEGFMKALNGVQDNQQKGSAPAPMGSPMPAMPGAMGKPQMPMMPPSKPMMNKGGPAMRPKSSGYCGM